MRFQCFSHPAIVNGHDGFLFNPNSAVSAVCIPGPRNSSQLIFISSPIKKQKIHSITNASPKSRFNSIGNIVNWMWAFLKRNTFVFYTSCERRWLSAIGVTHSLFPLCKLWREWWSQLAAYPMFLYPICFYFISRKHGKLRNNKKLKIMNYIGILV